MHELGIIIQVVQTVEEFAKENKLTVIEELVLQVGELSSMYPKYIEDVYPIAVENTMLADTKLVIEMLPGMGQCNSCKYHFNLKENDNLCPTCGADDWVVMTGTDFMIKEIKAY